MLGFNARNIERLSAKGAHLVAANHNSHLDALVLLSLFRLSDLKGVKVVAAKDYFCRNKWMTWFSMNIIGIVPIDRKGGTDDPLAPVMAALSENYTVIIFPEGSRGEAEKRQKFKYGIAKILEQMPNVTITPVFMHGLGKSLPRGEAVLVPFVCDVNIGEDISWCNDRQQLMGELETMFDRLEAEIAPKEWA